MKSLPPKDKISELQNSRIFTSIVSFIFIIWNHQKFDRKCYYWKGLFFKRSKLQQSVHTWLSAQDVSSSCNYRKLFTINVDHTVILPQPNQQHKTKQFGWSGIIIGKKNHTTTNTMWLHYKPLPGNLGSWFLVCSLILTQLEEIWKTTSIYFRIGGWKMKNTLAWPSSSAVRMMCTLVL